MSSADTSKIRIGILGASGYTGAELVRILLGHPNTEIAVLTGNTQAGQSFYSVYPQFAYVKVSTKISVISGDVLPASDTVLHRVRDVGAQR
jgi:N-acetyl-gamma-glutamyl-phosphate reductase